MRGEGVSSPDPPLHRRWAGARSSTSSARRAPSPGSGSSGSPGERELARVRRAPGRWRRPPQMRRGRQGRASNRLNRGSAKPQTRAPVLPQPGRKPLTRACGVLTRGHWWVVASLAETTHYDDPPSVTFGPKTTDGRPKGTTARTAMSATTRPSAIIAPGAAAVVAGPLAFSLAQTPATSQ
jgi:hypothetical protein